MPIPENFSACVRHFIKKGKPQKQAVAICYSVQRRRKSKAAHHVAKEHMKGKE